VNRKAKKMVKKAGGVNTTVECQRCGQWYDPKGLAGPYHRKLRCKKKGE